MKLITEGRPDGATLNKVRGILREAECVNEALAHTFGSRYLGMDKEHIYLGTFDGEVTDID